MREPYGIKAKALADKARTGCPRFRGA